MGLFAVIAAATYRHLPLSTPLREIAVLASPELAAAHALFGLVLGLWVLVRPWDVARELTAPEREVAE